MVSARSLAIGHGAYWMASGLWPIVDMRSFERVSGEKTDDWLVKTVGGLLASVGGVLARAGVTGRVEENVRTLAVETALVLTVVDVVYVTQKRIPKIYLLDAFLNVGLITSWLTLRLRRSSC